MTSVAFEDYLQAIFRLKQGRQAVATKALADELGVRPASVTGMIKRLAAKGYVCYEPYRGVRLTAKGRREAVDLLRRHRLIELFLTEVLGMSWHQVHQEAGRWEHVVSGEVLARIDALLGHPSHDPHGAPIPDARGRIARRSKTAVTDLRTGQAAIVAEVTDGNQDLLDYAGKLGLYPGARLLVVSIEPFKGPLTLLIDGKESIVGYTVAENIFVLTGRERHGD